MLNINVQSGGVWEDLDLANDTTIAITLEESGIADASIKGNGSNTIDIPRTQRNERILGCVGVAGVAGSPYTALPCYIYADGMPLMGGECKLYVISSDATKYSVTFTGKECAFYDNLAAVNLESEDNERILGTFRIGVGVDFNRLQGIKYGAGYTEQDETQDGREIYQQAAIQMSTLLTRVASLGGCSLNVSPWSRYYVLPRGRKPIPWYRHISVSNADNMGCHAKMTWHKSDLVDKKATFKWRELEAEGDVGVHVRLVMNAAITDMARFNIVVSAHNGAAGANPFGIANFSVGDESYMSYAESGFVRNPDGSNTIVRDICFYGGVRKATAGGSDNYALIKSIAQGAATFEGYISFSDLSDEHIADVVVELLTDGAEDSGVCWGAECSIANNIGFATALDIYKCAIQTKGLISHIDGRAVGNYSLNDVVNNKRNAADWSKYLISANVKYHGNYARRNNITLKDNSVSGRKDAFVFDIDDAMLAAEKDYIVLNAECGEDAVTCSYWKRGEYVDGVQQIERNDPSVSYIWDFNYGRLLSAEDVSDSYDRLFDILASNHREVEAVMVLPYGEISAFSHKTPVWLEQFARYFYVEKVENWIDGRTCTAHLLAL